MTRLAVAFAKMKNTIYCFKLGNASIVGWEVTYPVKNKHCTASAVNPAWAK
jgi:hypothetical protein